MLSPVCADPSTVLQVAEVPPPVAASRQTTASDSVGGACSVAGATSGGGVDECQRMITCVMVDMCAVRCSLSVKGRRYRTHFGNRLTAALSKGVPTTKQRYEML